MECPKPIKPDVVRLETPRLILRRFEISDAEEMYANWANDPEVTRYMIWTTHPNVEHSREILSKWVEGYRDNTCFNWAIEFKPEKTLVGSVGGDFMDPLIFSFGYCLSRAYWGRGIVPEAARAMIAYVFDNTNVNRIEAFHDPENSKSGRVMQKCGMILEGTLRQCLFTSNRGISDRVTYSILREDYERMRQPGA